MIAASLLLAATVPAAYVLGRRGSSTAPARRALAQRIQALEEERPRWKVELETIADRCHDVLDRADKRLKRAAAADARDVAGAAGADQDPEVMRQTINLAARGGGRR